MLRSLLILIACFCTSAGLTAQTSTADVQEKLVQFSGMVLDGTGAELVAIPYAAVVVKSDQRGTYANLEGFFSIVARQGDTIAFTALGYEDAEYIIPTDLEEDKYSMVQLMTTNTYELPPAVVFPWPSREHFKLEFLAMDVTPELQSRASENLSADRLQNLRETVATDGGENASYYMRQQVQQTYYIGQRPPMNIFSPVAWKQFFDSWKRGDYRNRDRERN
ncbi:MAG: carboxypeptidase-like regulatory domain-containing protein [Bacteroidota bacterium]